MKDTKQEIRNRKRQMELKKSGLYLKWSRSSSATAGWRATRWTGVSDGASVSQSSSKNSRTVIHTFLHNYLKTNTVQHSHLVLCTRGWGAGPLLRASVFSFPSSSLGIPWFFGEKFLQEKRGKKYSKSVQQNHDGVFIWFQHLSLVEFKGLVCNISKKYIGMKWNQKYKRMFLVGQSH